MLKEIPLSHLAVGMFVECYGDGSFHNPKRSLKEYVHSTRMIEELAREGVPSVVIDDEKTLTRQAAPPRSGQPGKDRPRGTEMPSKAYDDCLLHVQDVMEKVRQGCEVDFSQSYSAVDQLLAGVDENPAHMTLLSKLRSFDDYTFRHSLNVSVLSIIFAKHLGMQGDDLRRLGFAGLYHDVGKFRVPVEILNKPGRLSDREFSVMKEHSRLGYELMRGHPGTDKEILMGILHHHERYDGTGYPLQMGQEGRDRFSPIISVADIFDALTSRRSYKKASPPHDALKAMFCWRNETFPPGMLERFVECFGVYPPGTFVRLSDQSHGLVMEARPESPARPVVKINFTRRLQPMLPKLVDLSTTPKSAQGGLDIEACLDAEALRIPLERFI